SSFAALMALSANQTRQSEAAVQTALAEKQRRERLKRKEIEEKERKEREMEARMRLKRLEEEKREQERQARLEREREAREHELKRREEEERARLVHGPKKGGRTDSNGYPVSRLGRRGSDDSDNDGAGASALTREEKRRRRMELEMRHGTQNGRRSNPSGGYAKAGRRLPGGAVDITTTPGAQAADATGTMSIRQRLAQAPTLIKLNVNKRDTRTIDEILQDRAKAKAKTLQGDEAKEFKDWFGKAKEAKAVSQANSASTSRANTPATSGQKSALSRTQSGSASPTSKTPNYPRPPAPFPSAKGSASSSQRPAGTRPLPIKTPATFRSKTPVPLGKTGTATSSKVALSAGKPAAKKRPRSPSLTPSRSPSPAPPPKKRAVPAANDFSSEIWKLFGKDRSRYVAADVVSDDEDMEAGASDLEREELRSARIARKEDELAMEEERRHEEEKRRKRKEKDR
ncbi:hypothetical protein FOMPIDRAFT_14044, partial [Fomitopsis schrenkii]